MLAGGERVGDRAPSPGSSGTAGDVHEYLAETGPKKKKKGGDVQPLLVGRDLDRDRLLLVHEGAGRKHSLEEGRTVGLRGVGMPPDAT